MAAVHILLASKSFAARQASSWPPQDCRRSRSRLTSAQAAGALCFVSSAQIQYSKTAASAKTHKARRANLNCCATAAPPLLLPRTRTMAKSASKRANRRILYNKKNWTGLSAAHSAGQIIDYVAQRVAAGGLVDAVAQHNCVACRRAPLPRHSFGRQKCASRHD